MVQSRSPKRAGLIPAILLLVFATGSGVASAQSADNALQMIPSNSLFCVRINNLDNALGQVDMFLSSIMPLNVSMQVKAQLGQILGSATASGVYTAGSFTLFGPLPGAGDPTQIGILIPVNNYQRFLSDNKNIGATDTSGISKFGPEGAEMGAVIQVGSYALMTLTNGAASLPQAKEALSASSRGLAGALDSAELKRATSSPVWVYANMQLAGQMFGPMVQAQLAEVKSTFDEMEAQGMNEMASAKGAIDMYSAMLDSLMKEARYVSFDLTPSASEISLGMVLAAVPGSDLASMLQGAATKPDNKLMGYLDNNAAIYFSGTASSPSWQKINDAYIGMLPTLLGKEFSAEDMKALQDMVAQSAKVFAGPIAGSLSVDTENKPPFQVTYVAAVTDPAKFYQVLEQSSKMMSSGPIADMYANMGLKFTFDVERDAETYKNVSITTMKFDMTPTDANSPQAAMLDNMYGDGFNIQLAATDGLLVYALAKDPSPILHKMIDKVKAGAPGQVPAKMQAGMQLIPGADKADFFATYNLLQVAQLMLAWNPIPLPIQIPEMPSQIPAGMAIAGNIADGKATLDVAVSPQQIAQAMQLYMQIQMQQMQMQMEED